jgi:hypothetical protein
MLIVVLLLLQVLRPVVCDSSDLCCDETEPSEYAEIGFRDVPFCSELEEGPLDVSYTCTMPHALV